MKKIFVLISLLSIILALSLLGLKDLGSKSQQQGKAVLIIKTIGNTSREEVKLTGISALEMLKQKHNVKIIETPLAKSIECIDNICAKNMFWWKFKVNGNKILSSTDKYYPNNGDEILLEYGDAE